MKNELLVMILIIRNKKMFRAYNTYNNQYNLGSNCLIKVCKFLYSNEAMIVANEQMDCIDANMDQIRKHNHSEIEKRRREKMNFHIKELANLVPMCNAMPSTRKLDKLTVLRMTVQHIKAVKNSTALSDPVNRTPSFISDEIIAKLLYEGRINPISYAFHFIIY
jgi:hypothetical protein